MKHHSILTLCFLTILVIPTVSSMVDTTAFYNNKVGYTLNFKSYSGYEDIDWYYPKGNAAMYYSLWQQPGSNLANEEVPVIVWLQGGPGGASQFGCFNELGPLFIQGNKDYKVIENPYGWNKLGHLLCPDQPIGVGFSYNKQKMVTDSYTAGHHFTNFLYNFLTEWKLHKNPLYLAGESYAGHYIPVFARMLMLNRTLDINFKGVMIGDGYVDPVNQINFYDSTLYSMGLSSSSARDTITFMQTQSMINIFNGSYSTSSDYINWIIDTEAVGNQFFCGVNIENYRLYDSSNINEYYAGFLKANKDSFGVPAGVDYRDDNHDMYLAFGDDLSQSMADELQFILDRGLRVLIYNGQNDIIVNTAGVLNYLNTLNWRGLIPWQRASKTQWYINGVNSGWSKRHDNFVFMVVRNAGHLLPADQPKLAYRMIEEFLQGSF